MPLACRINVFNHSMQSLMLGRPGSELLLSIRRHYH